MGSPISVALAELVMQRIEKQIFRSSPFEIPVWKRYVDDIFAIIPADKQDILLTHINPLTPRRTLVAPFTKISILC